MPLNDLQRLAEVRYHDLTTNAHDTLHRTKPLSALTPDSLDQIRLYALQQMKTPELEHLLSARQIHLNQSPTTDPGQRRGWQRDVDDITVLLASRKT